MLTEVFNFGPVLFFFPLLQKEPKRSRLQIKMITIFTHAKCGGLISSPHFGAYPSYYAWLLILAHFSLRPGLKKMCLRSPIICPIISSFWLPFRAGAIQKKQFLMHMTSHSLFRSITLSRFRKPVSCLNTHYSILNTLSIYKSLYNSLSCRTSKYQPGIFLRRPRSQKRR